MEIELKFPEPNALELSTMSNLGSMLQEFMPDWTVKYMRVEVPYELRAFFVNGTMFNRATYQLYKYEHEFFIHVDFKEKVEIYVIQKRHTEILRRKLYIVDRPDSLKLFRIITDELEKAAYGYQESEAG
uniref:DUF5655 domain-containing protein n=1 Tax=Pseudomonas phage HRDY3 TaxID=3236930 RepID=A0AB39CDS0_9VIRU